MRKICLDQHHESFSVLASTPRGQAAVMTLGPGESTGGPDNRHDGKDQWLIVRSGTGQATIEGKRLDFAAGDLILIEAGEAHEIRCTSDEPLVTLNIYAPPEY